MPISFSIIIPTRSRPNVVNKTLQQFSKLDYPRESFEVIVVENPSTDEKTKEVIKVMEEKGNVNFRYLTLPNRGAAAARNSGIAAATFDNLIFIDDDAVISPAFLQGYDRAWRKYPNAGILGGRTLAVTMRLQHLSETEAKLVQSHDWCFGQCDFGMEDTKLKIGKFLLSANMSIHRTKKKRNPSFDKIFSERLGYHLYFEDYLRGEDLELCSRYLLEGHDVIFIADEALTVKNPVSVKRFTDSEIFDRYVVSGVSLSIVESELQRKFPSLRSFFFQVIEPTRGFERRSDFQSDRFRRAMLVSYHRAKKIHSPSQIN